MAIKNILSLLIVFSVVLIPNSETGTKERNAGLYSRVKFIVKTKSELKVSESTGDISINTGIKSFDDKNDKFKIKKIKPIFKVNNGDTLLFEKLGMGRIYLFYPEDYSLFDPKKISEEYNKDDFVEYCEPDFIGFAAGVKGKEYIAGELPKSNDDKEGLIPNDEMFYKQWSLRNDGTIQTSPDKRAKVGADINAIKAWEIETGSDEVIVAILDSGIKDDHPDLRDRIWINKKEIPNNGIDDDGNGYIDDYQGWDFAYKSENPMDGYGHGTNIATVIGAITNNRIGFAGINHKSRLMNCKNLSDDNYGEYSWWVESIKYAADNGAKIINMSEGGDEYSKTLSIACEYAMERGSMIIAAMMNRGDNGDYYPARFKGVFAVGATDVDDTRCKRFTWGGGSCWGNHIAVVAPGNKIYGLDCEDNNRYEVYWSGTSQATAMVSALASLLLSQDKSRTTDDIKNIIIKTARDQIGDPREDVKGWDRFYGYGRIDCYLALVYLKDPALFKEKEKSEDVRKEDVGKEEISSENDRAKSQKSKSDDAKSPKENENKPAKKVN